MARLWILWLSAALVGPALAAGPAAPAEPTLPVYEFPTTAAVTRGADLRGRVVETRDGEELGRVHDFAVDLESGRLAYVVVSVGSFLIEDSLIAVAPEALRDSADPDGRLVLEADAASLRAARRFAAGDWPRRADVLAQTTQTEAGTTDSDAAAAPGAAARGTATISDGSKTATLSAGERRIEFAEPPAAPPADRDSAARAAPTTRFGRLDRDGNGTLNRAEIAHEMQRGDRFAEIDSDGSGAIDEAEFDALMKSRADG